ncbi:hypothetical protein Ancab_031400 [Ancistrocladus abbreviatus]
MASSALLKLTCVMLAFIMVASPYAEAITCSQVYPKIEPCRSYLVDGGRPSTACCNGVRELNALAKPGQARREACECLKTAAEAFDFKHTNAERLPGLCRVNLGFEINNNVNCNAL